MSSVSNVPRPFHFSPTILGPGSIQHIMVNLSAWPPALHLAMTHQGYEWLGNSNFLWLYTHTHTHMHHTHTHTHTHTHNTWVHARTHTHAHTILTVLTSNPYAHPTFPSLLSHSHPPILPPLPSHSHPPTFPQYTDLQNTALQNNYSNGRQRYEDRPPSGSYDHFET